MSDDISREGLFRNDIELHLQGEIDSQALLLHYPPEVALRSGAIVAAEALVCWRHPTRALLQDSFVGIAESIDLAGELGRGVLRNACTEFSRWRSRGVGQIAVLRNVSPLQLATRGFVRNVADTMIWHPEQRHGVVANLALSAHAFPRGQRDPGGRQQPNARTDAA